MALAAGALVLVAIVVAAILLLSGGNASPEAQIQSVLESEVKLVEEGRWKDVHELLSRGYRERCSPEDIRDSGAREFLASLKGKVRIEDLQAQIAGDHAKVTYRVLVDGEEFTTIGPGDPDLFVRVDGTWYDDYDGLAFC